MSAYIYDGYTETHVFPVEESLCGVAVKASVRPMTAHELARMAEETEGLKPAKHREKVAELVAPHIHSWDIKSSDGQILPISPKTYLQLRQNIFNWLFSCVCGNRAGMVNDQKN
jgi:hypothetical protein